MIVLTFSCVPGSWKLLISDPNHVAHSIINSPCIVLIATQPLLNCLSVPRVEFSRRGRSVVATNSTGKILTLL